MWMGTQVCFFQSPFFLILSLSRSIDTCLSMLTTSIFHIFFWRCAVVVVIIIIINVQDILYTLAQVCNSMCVWTHEIGLEPRIRCACMRVFVCARDSNAWKFIHARYDWTRERKSAKCVIEPEPNANTCFIFKLRTKEYVVSPSTESSVCVFLCRVRCSAPRLTIICVYNEKYILWIYLVFFFCYFVCKVRSSRFPQYENSNSQCI